MHTEPNWQPPVEEVHPAELTDEEMVAMRRGRFPVLWSKEEAAGGLGVENRTVHVHGRCEACGVLLLDVHVLLYVEQAAGRGTRFYRRIDHTGWRELGVRRAAFCGDYHGEHDRILAVPDPLPAACPDCSGSLVAPTLDEIDRAGRPDFPRSRYDRQVERRPLEPGPLNDRARYWDGREDYPRALADYERSLDLRPEQEDAVHRSYLICLLRTAREAVLRPPTPDAGWRPARICDVEAVETLATQVAFSSALERDRLPPVATPRARLELILADDRVVVAAIEQQALTVQWPGGRTERFALSEELPQLLAPFLP
jgi:hypothetical protein